MSPPMLHGLRVIELQAIEGLPRTNQALGDGVCPHMMSPQDKVVQPDEAD